LIYASILVPETQKDSHCQVEGHRFVAFNQARNEGLGPVVSETLILVAREVHASSDKLCSVVYGCISCSQRVMMFCTNIPLPTC